jgi:predicted CXXCH cytochrome family protein
MPSSLRDPKSLPEWIEPDYFRRLRWLRGVWGRLFWAVFLASAVGAALLFALGPPTLYQAGPVAPAHSSFNEDCARCHTEPFQAVRRLHPFAGAAHSVPDSACLGCHDGPPHNDQAAAPACAGCHREHRGRERLTDVADAFCTDCHRDLKRGDGRPSEVQNVAGDFAGSHPPFRLPSADGSRIKFNHQVHLNPEGVRGPGPDAERLDCASCHQPDGGRRSMKPVNYEAHCSRCHPLALPLAGVWLRQDLNEAADAYRAKTAPHPDPGEGAAAVRAAVRHRLTELAEQHLGLLAPENAKGAERPIAGRLRLFAEAARDQPSWVGHQLRLAEKVLFEGPGGCRYCHVPQGPPPSAEFLSTDIPARWFRHAEFDHDSHRAVGCAECHAARGSSKAGDVLLPGVDLCRRCHNPREGVRSACVICHAYHDRGREHGWNRGLPIEHLVGGRPPKTPR